MRLSEICWHVVVGVWLCGCGSTIAPEDSEAELGRSSQPILHGTPTAASAASPVYLSTVAITTVDKVKKRQAACSGTLIAPRVVVTAAHCHLGYNERLTLAPRQPVADLRVFFGKEVSATNPNVRRVVGRLSCFGYNAIGSMQADPPSEPNDLAIFLLDQDAPAPFVPATIDADTAIPEGEELVLAGFGRTIGPGNSSTTYSDDTGTLRQAVSEVLSGIDLATAHEHLLIAKRLAVGSAAYGDAWNNAVGACSGDSGGPAFRNVNGRSLLRGALSSGALDSKGRCSGRSIYTDLAQYMSWVEPSIVRLTESVAKGRPDVY